MCAAVYHVLLPSASATSCSKAWQAWSLAGLLTMLALDLCEQLQANLTSYNCIRQVASVLRHSNQFVSVWRLFVLLSLSNVSRSTEAYLMQNATVSDAVLS